MIILGIDFGQKRVGLAIAKEGIAFPYQTLFYSNLDSLMKEIKEVCQKEKIEKIVLGLAKTKKGEIGFEAKKQIEFKKKLENKLKIPIILQNEILTTKEAERILEEQKIKKDKIQRLKDSLAAQLLLESYLESFLERGKGG